MIRGYESYGFASFFRGVRLEPIGRGSLGVASNRKEILDFLKGAGVATVLLLLIAGANVASLFLARALQRRKEMATAWRSVQRAARWCVSLSAKAF